MPSKQEHQIASFLFAPVDECHEIFCAQQLTSWIESDFQSTGVAFPGVEPPWVNLAHLAIRVAGRAFDELLSHPVRIPVTGLSYEQ